MNINVAKLLKEQSDNAEIKELLGIKKEIMDLIKTVGQKGEKMRGKDHHFFTVQVPEGTLHLAFTPEGGQRFNADIQSIYITSSEYTQFDGTIFSIYGYGEKAEVRGTEINDKETLEQLRDYLKTLDELNESIKGCATHDERLDKIHHFRCANPVRDFTSFITDLIKRDNPNADYNHDVNDDCITSQICHINVNSDEHEAEDRPKISNPNPETTEGVKRT